MSLKREKGDINEDVFKADDEKRRFNSSPCPQILFPAGAAIN